MNALVLDTVPIWTVILGFGVFLYVLLDGFDLGVGMLFGLAPDTPSRNLVMNSIAPIWDGNETWLVLGGLALLAAFPLAFAIIIPAVYFPILVIANDRDYVGEHTNGRALNTIATAYLVLLVVVAIVTVPLIIITKGGA